MTVVGIRQTRIYMMYPWSVKYGDSERREQSDLHRPPHGSFAYNSRRVPTLVFFINKKDFPRKESP